MKYFIIAGEASGDLHGSNLIKSIKEIDPSSTCKVWGGELMENQGAQLLKHYKELAFMGFVEVLANLRTIFKNLNLCKNQILAFSPDALILIDYPGFNLRIAKWAKKNNIKVFYYISPQVWAWKSSRAKTLKKTVTRLISILPFEKKFYQKYHFDIDYVGHPLLDAIAHYAPRTNALLEDPQKKIIALLPGSRKQEVSRLLPVMIEAVTKFESDYQIIIAGVNHFNDEYYHSIAKFNYPILYNSTYDLLSKAYAAIVTSGTATLETALFGVPQVVCYKGSGISVAIARRLVNINYISLVNLIAEKEVVKELIQNDCHAKSIQNELCELLNQGEGRKKMESEYVALKLLLGNAGASKAAAEIIVNEIEENE